MIMTMSKNVVSVKVDDSCVMHVERLAKKVHVFVGLKRRETFGASFWLTWYEFRDGESDLNQLSDQREVMLTKSERETNNAP